MAGVWRGRCLLPGCGRCRRIANSGALGLSPKRGRQVLHAELFGDEVTAHIRTLAAGIDVKLAAQVAFADRPHDIGHGHSRVVASDVRVQLERRRVRQGQLRQIKPFGEVPPAQVHFKIQLAQIERLEGPALGVHPQVARDDVQIERVGMLRVQNEQGSAGHTQLEGLLIDGAAPLDSKRSRIAFRFVRMAWMVPFTFRWRISSMRASLPSWISKSRTAGSLLGFEAGAFVGALFSKVQLARPLLVLMQVHVRRKYGHSSGSITSPLSSGRSFRRISRRSTVAIGRALSQGGLPRVRPFTVTVGVKDQMWTSRLAHRWLTVRPALHARDPLQSDASTVFQSNTASTNSTTTIRLPSTDARDLESLRQRDVHALRPFGCGVDFM